eukprot:gene11890-biopygen12445
MQRVTTLPCYPLSRGTGAGDVRWSGVATAADAGADGCLPRLSCPRRLQCPAPAWHQKTCPLWGHQEPSRQGPAPAGGNRNKTGTCEDLGVRRRHSRRGRSPGAGVGRTVEKWVETQPLISGVASGTGVVDGWQGGVYSSVS